MLLIRVFLGGRFQHSLPPMSSTWISAFAASSRILALSSRGENNNLSGGKTPPFVATFGVLVLLGTLVPSCTLPPRTVMTEFFCTTQKDGRTADSSWNGDCWKLLKAWSLHTFFWCWHGVNHHLDLLKSSESTAKLQKRRSSCKVQGGKSQRDVNATWRNAWLKRVFFVNDIYIYIYARIYY